MKQLRGRTIRFLTLVAVLLSLGLPAGGAWAAYVKNVRIWPAPDHTRLVFDLSGATDHKVFTLSSPDRIVLDLPKASLKANLDNLKLPAGPIQSLRSGDQQGKLRLVLDLSRSVRPKSFALEPNEQYGHRLVVDLYDPQETPVKAVRPPSNAGGRDIIIAVDAGHGGDDPGALGPNRVREKDVVLRIAKELDRLLDETPGYRGELVRNDDYYIPLRGRTNIARKMNADMFVSIHADAFKDARAKGASVWVLSHRGASGEVGRWLAKRENSADLIGGVGSVSLEDKGDMLAGVLLDMSMTASRADSQKLAKRIHQKMSGFARMHKPFIEQANFAVLRSPDIPSVLVETGFISSPAEAKQLKSAAYQKKMAAAIFDGIKTHFNEKPPAFTTIALSKAREPVFQTYKVQKGDSLSKIAKANGVSIAAIKTENKLSSDVIWVGQKLRIPAS